MSDNDRSIIRSLSDRDTPIPQRDQVRGSYPGGHGIEEGRGSRFAIERPYRDSACTIGHVHGSTTMSQCESSFSVWSLD